MMLEGRCHRLRHVPHVEEDLTELLANLEKRVQSSAVGSKTSGLKVVLFELGILPSATVSLA